MARPGETRAGPFSVYNKVLGRMAHEAQAGKENEGMAYKVKTNEEGKAALNESGMPVFVDDSGKEATFETVQSDWGQRLAEVNSEAAKHRIAKKDAANQLQQWTDLGLTHDEVKAAIDKAAKIDLSKMTTAEAVEAKIKAVTESLTREKAEAEKVYAAKLAEQARAIEDGKATVHKLVVSNSFATNPFFNDRAKTLMDPLVAELVFGSKFRVEDGHPICYPDGFDASGEPLGQPFYSRKDPGKLAGMEEALESLWSTYPHRDRYTPAVGGGDGSRGDRGSDKRSARSLLEQSQDALAKGNVAASIALKNQHFQQAPGQ